MEKTAMQINQDIMDLIIRFFEVFEAAPNTVIIDLAQSKKLFEDEIRGKSNIATPAEEDKFVLGEKEYGSELKIFTVTGENILKVGLVGDNDFFDKIEREMEALKE